MNEQFGWPEYVMFGVMLLISASIGIFFGFCGSKQRTTSEFLMADRNMGIFPVAMSLVASFISAITMLGTPAEIYVFGTQYWVIIFSLFFVILSSSQLYMPIFYNLRLMSAYEYLELRFAKPVRLLGSVIFTLQMTLYMALVTYAPSLALSQVTGIKLIVSVVLLFVVCIFYTSIGGLKAVMWTDVFQVFIMFGSLILVIVKGVIDLGGGANIWQANLDGDRIHFFEISPDPRVRHTIWGLLIGGYFHWLTIYGTNQTEIQRYLAVPERTKATKALWLNLVALIGIISISCFVGLILYAKYADCHPIYTGRAKSTDQLLPLFVMDSLSEFPGLPGLFVAGIFSGALSTVSSGLNSLATIVLEDMIRGAIYPKISERASNITSKLLTVLFGLIAFGLVFVVQKMGAVQQATYLVFGMISGPLLGVFTLGMFFPWANAKGAFCGTLISMAFLFWLGISTTMATLDGDLVLPKLHFGTSGCSINETVVIPPVKIGKHGGLLELFRISYIWYSTIGCWMTVVTGLIITCLTSNPKKNARKLNPDLISRHIDNLIHFILPESWRIAIGWEIGVEYEKKSKNYSKKMFKKDSELKDMKEVNVLSYNNSAFVNE